MIKDMNLFSSIKRLALTINDHLLYLISLSIIVSTALYYLGSLNTFWLISATILIIALFLITNKYFIKSSDNASQNFKFSPKYLYLIGGYLLFTAYSFRVLWLARSGRALISPWEIVGPEFFLAYAAASLFLIILLTNKKINSGAKLVALSVHYLLTFSVAALVYRLGYGFDPFIHQAAMELIDKKGVITPKTPYYIGQYGLELIIHQLSNISIPTIDRLLLPLMGAFFLPSAISRFLKKFSEPDEGAELSAAGWLSSLFIIVFVSSLFIVTTPQNLAYLFLILTILNSLSRPNYQWALILALAATAIHPLAGLPALILAAYTFLNNDDKKWLKKIKKYITAFLFIIGAGLLPLALFWSGGRNWRWPVFNFGLSLTGAGREDWLMNFLYLLADNYLVIFSALALISLIIFWRHFPAGRNLVYSGASLLVAYFLVLSIDFQNLINYEQGDYAGRLLVVVALFCLPFVLLLLNLGLKKIWQADNLSRFIWGLAGVGLLTSSLYLSYPRFDKYHNSRGYSVSDNDIAAVQTISKQAKASFIVIANQQVGAAAMKESGFDHYFSSTRGPLYFYSIPTGGPLYQFYLDMVYKSPSRETMQKAMDLAGVKNGYFVINKYWRQSGRIINAAKLSADSWQSINDEIYIFAYQR